jgi:signal transduction histidine kinase
VLTNDSQIITQAKEQERSRIYANLHDDVGAKLLELIYSAESDKTKNLAKEVLSNIRQAVAATINIQCNSQQIAEEISQEIQARLKHLPIEFTEHFDTLTKQKIAANIPSVLSRIMREATSNIIKHAQATEVSLSILSTDKYLSLVLEDNGIGFNTGKQEGKGLKTIQKRAHSINAEVNWIQLQTQGTKFTLIYHYGNE